MKCLLLTYDSQNSRSILNELERPVMKCLLLTYDSQNSRSILNELERPMMKCLLQAIHSYRVSFYVYIKKEANFEFSSLVGNDKKKLLNQLPSKMPNCQPPAFYKVVQQIWEVNN